MSVNNVTLLADALPHVGEVSDSIVVLAQGGVTTLDGSSAEDTFQGFDIKFGSDITNIARIAGAMIAIAWVIFAISKFASPSSRAGGSMMQRVGGAGPLIAAVIFVAMLLDLNVSMKFVNWILKIGWQVIAMIQGAMGD